MQKEAKFSSANKMEVSTDGLFGTPYAIFQPVVVGEIVFDKIVKDIDLKNKELIRVGFQNCIFRNCDFSGSLFLSCTIEDCLFIECDFTGVELSDTVVNSGIFEDCKIEQLISKENTCYTDGEFMRCDGSIELAEGSFLTNVLMAECDLRGSNFSDCFLTDVEFTGCDLSYITVSPNFGSYELTFNTCCLKGTDFNVGEAFGRVDEKDCYTEKQEKTESTDSDDYLDYYFNQLHNSNTRARNKENRSLDFYCSNEQLIKEVLNSEHICPLQQVGFIFGESPGGKLTQVS